MRVKFLMSALSAAVLAVGAASPASANLIANGTFASTCSGPGFCTYSAGDSTDIPGWTVQSGSVDLITTYWQAPPGGGNTIDLDGSAPGSISTQFSTVAGDSYLVTFYLSGNPDGSPATKELEVSADGSSEDYTYTTGTNTHGNMEYSFETFKFVANVTGLSTLLFASLDSDTPYGPVIGDVDAAAVPEPGSLGLLGGALLALAGSFAFRRREKRSA